MYIMYMLTCPLAHYEAFIQMSTSALRCIVHSKYTFCHKRFDFENAIATKHFCFFPNDF